MFRRTAFCLAAAALATVVLPASSYAGKFNKVLDIGDKAPAWSDLVATDGSRHSLAGLKGAKAVVVVFSCNKCPVAVAYEDRLIQLTEDYKDKGVRVIVIDVNKNENLEQMKKRAKDKGFNFPYIYDETQETARDYGATCTPHVFLLDRDRKIAYMGSVDDNKNSPTKPYLRNALDAVLAGKTPPVTETRQFGCSIKWK